MGSVLFFGLVKKKMLIESLCVQFMLAVYVMMEKNLKKLNLSFLFPVSYTVSGRDILTLETFKTFSVHHLPFPESKDSMVRGANILTSFTFDTLLCIWRRDKTDQKKRIVLSPKDIPHNVKNTSDEDAKILVVKTPRP